MKAGSIVLAALLTSCNPPNSSGTKDPADDVTFTEAATDAISESDLEQARPNYSSPDEIAIEFKQNQVLANDKYRGKGLIFRGVIDSVEQRDAGQSAAQVYFKPSFSYPIIKADVGLDDARSVRAEQTVILACDGAQMESGQIALQGCGLNATEEPARDAPR